MAQIGPGAPGSGGRPWGTVRTAVHRVTATRLPAACSVSRLALFVALVAGIVLVSLTFDAQKIEGLLMWVQDHPKQGSVLFLSVYIVGVVLMLPAMVMAMAAGAVFGMLYGSLLVWVGSSVGQTAAFVVGRYLLRELVVQYLSKQFPKWPAIDKALETEGWKLVTLLRLSPIAPWNVLNYALAVTAVPLASYVIASSLAILPYLLLFVYFGSLARNLADIFTGNAGLDSTTTMVMAGVSGVLMVVIVWYTTHLSRKAISTALVAGGDGEQMAEMAADPDVAELLRVNSGEMSAAAEHFGTPLGSARSTAHHHSIFSGASASSPRDHGVELCAVLAVGGGGASGGKSSGAGTPQHSQQQQQQQHLLAKKHTPAPAGEMVQLLDRLQGDSAGGSSTGGPSSAGGSRVHLRSSYTGEGGALGGSSSNVSPLGFVAAARGRLTSLTSG